MLKAFFTALGMSLLQGPVVVAAAFPLGLLMFAAYLALLSMVTLLFLIPFVGKAIAFSLSLIVWTFAARFAGSLAGLRRDGQAQSFTSALWAALPAVFVIKIGTALLVTGINFAAMEVSAAGHASEAGNILHLSRDLEHPVAALETLLIVIFILPACCDAPARAMSLYTLPLLLGRCALAALAAFCVTIFAASPLKWAIDLIRKGGLAGLDHAEVVRVLSALAFYLGMITWLLAGILFAFEANFLRGRHGARPCLRRPCPRPRPRASSG